MRSRNGGLILYWKVLKEAVNKFFGEGMLTHSAALAYYMVFSLPPILLIVLWTTAQFYSEVAVRGAIFSEIGSLVGEEGAQQVMAALENVAVHEPTWWASAFGIGVLLFTATTVFDGMRTALNQVVEVKVEEAGDLGIWRMLRVRFIAFGFVVSISFMLLVALMVDALITTAGSYLGQWIGALATHLMVFDYLLFDLGATTLLFVMYFRYLPDVKHKVGDVWFGALVTAGLFVVGKHMIGLFIGNSQVATVYDAAGSILVLMLWVYYAAAIFLLGATFTFTRARLLNTGLEAADNATRIRNST
jgi:membrane protein